MKTKMAAEIKKQMEQKTTDELLSIWIKNDREEWSNDAFEAVKLILLERGENLPQQETSKADESLENSEMKGPWGWRVARLLAVMLFVVLCGVLSTGIAYLVGELYGIGIFILIISALLCVAATLSVKWLSKHSFQTATAKSDYGWMIVIGGVSILYLGLSFSMSSYSDTLWGFISAGSYLLVGIGGLWMLLRSRRFVWQKYAVVGVGIVALTLPIYIPQMQSMSGYTWARDHEDAFQPLIQEAEEAGLCTGNILHDVAMHEFDLMNIQSIEALIIVLVAEDVTDTASSLAISAVSGQLPKNLRAESSSDVQFLLIHGEPGPFRGSLTQTQDLVAPVLLYSWPNKKMIGSGRLVIGEMGWGISRGEAYHRIAQMIRQR